MIGAALDGLAVQLRAAGFGSVDADPEVLSPSPVAIWLQPRTLTGFTLGGGGTVTVWVYLIAAGETAQALTLLDDALAAVLPLVTPARDEPVDLAAAVALPDTPPLPAYRVAVAIDLDDL